MERHPAVDLPPAQDLMEAAPDAMLLVDEAGRVVAANRRAEEMFGYARAELLRLAVDQLLPERFLEKHAGHRAAYAHEPKTRPMAAGVELYGRRRDGTEVPLEISLSPIQHGSGLFVLASVRDATERRETERRLRETTLRMEEAQRMAKVGSFEWDVPTNRVTWSRQLHEIYGVPFGQFEGTLEAFLRRLHPDDRDRVGGIVQSVLQKGGAVQFQERIVRPDGEERVLETTAEAVLDAAGAPLRFVGSCQDVTERRRVEAMERRQFVGRKIVRRILRDLTQGGAGTIHARREMGRALANETKDGDVGAYLDAFTAMAIGEIKVASLQEGRYEFTGDGLLEMTPNAGIATCHIALGYLEGIVAQLTGRPSLGVETECQSQGHAACRFVVRAKGQP